jgi:hypothetical protein
MTKGHTNVRLPLPIEMNFKSMYTISMEFKAGIYVVYVYLHHGKMDLKDHTMNNLPLIYVFVCVA